jgi:tRNA U34 5-carboxymethylaminomethyl modifying GTPase MnmE/TrmE
MWRDRREHYGVEQLIQYGATYSEDGRLVENPARAKLRKKIDELQAEIVFKEAELGQALEFNDEKVRKTARGMKLAHSALRREINGLYERVQRLEHRLAQTPTKVALGELTGKQLRATMKTGRRNLVNVEAINQLNGRAFGAGERLVFALKD